MTFNFKPVADEDIPDILKKSVAVTSDSNKADTTVEIPDDDGHFIITDINGGVIGKLSYPNVVCPGMACKAAQGRRHPFSFRFDSKHSRWVHSACGRPSQLAWEASWNEMVVLNEDVEVPWKVGPSE